MGRIRLRPNAIRARDAEIDDDGPDTTPQTLRALFQIARRSAGNREGRHARQDDVRGLQITMHQRRIERFMELSDRIAHGGHDRKRQSARRAHPLDQRRNRLALDVFHDDRQPIPCGTAFDKPRHVSQAQPSVLSAPQGFICLAGTCGKLNLFPDERAELRAVRTREVHDFRRLGRRAL